MNAVFQALPLQYAGMGLVGLGLTLSLASLLSGDSFLNHYYQIYTRSLDRTLRLLFMKGSGSRIALAQLLTLAALVAAVLALELPPTYYALLVLTAVSPSVYLERLRKQHVRRVEGQVDAFIVGLANALKSVPSPAAALAQLIVVLPNPTRLEIDRVLKEMRVGSTLEQGLVNMSSRLKSRELDSALSAVLIGLQVGGNLPLVLENTAATIREMNRLEGVVRTKTSESRAQLWVLALFPFVIALGFRTIDSEYFVPLQGSFVGTLIVTIAALFWIAALLTARKILKVDI